MRNFWNCYFWLIIFIAAYLLFWIFGDIIFFLVILIIIGEILVLKSIYRIKFFLFDIIIIGVYLFLCLMCLLFVFIPSFKIFLIVVGAWMAFTFFFHKRW